MARVVVTLPKQARRGEIIEIRTLAGHAMDTGFRRNCSGPNLPDPLLAKEGTKPRGCGFLPSFARRGGGRFQACHGIETFDLSSHVKKMMSKKV